MSENDKWFDLYSLREFGKVWQDVTDDFYKTLCKLCPGEESMCNTIRFYMKNKYVFPSFTFLKNGQADSVVVNMFNNFNFCQIIEYIRKGMTPTVFYSLNARERSFGRLREQYRPEFNTTARITKENIRQALDTACDYAKIHDGIEDPHYILVFEDPKLAYLADQNNVRGYGKVIGVDGSLDPKVRFNALFDATVLDDTNTLEIFRHPSRVDRLKILKKNRVDTRELDKSLMHPDMTTCSFAKHKTLSFVSFVNMHGIEDQKDFDDRCRVASALSSIIAYANGGEPLVSLAGVMNTEFNMISLEGGSVAARDENERIAGIFGTTKSYHVCSVSEDKRLFEALQIHTGIEQYKMERYKRTFYVNESDHWFEFAKENFELREDALIDKRWRGECILEKPADGSALNTKNPTFSKLVIAEKLSKKWIAPAWTNGIYNNFVRVEIEPEFGLDIMKEFLGEKIEFFPYLSIKMKNDLVEVK